MIKLFTVNMDADAALARLDPVLRSGYVAEGPQSRAFEQALREYLRWPYAVLTSSGTAALTLAVHVAGLGPGDVVISTPLTCLITNEVLDLRGCRIEWADIDPATGNLDPESVRHVAANLRANGERVAAIMCVHWGGSTLGIPALREVAAELGVPLIEDAAHSIGGVDAAGGMVGTQADFSCFSFQAIKTLTCGDGGLLTCRHAHHSERARLLRWFGLDRTKSESMRSYQQVPESGYKFHLNDIGAAIGLANLPHLDHWVATQCENAEAYDMGFADVDGIRPLRRNPGSSCWLYTVRVRNARTFMAAMAGRGVECLQVHTRNDTQAIWASSRRLLPGMDVLNRELVCLPVGPHVTPERRQRVIAAAVESA